MPIQLTERFIKQYRQLSRTIRSKVDRAIWVLDVDSRYIGLRDRPIDGAEKVFEAFIDTKYRMTFERRSNVFVLRNVDNHDYCLRNP